MGYTYLLSKKKEKFNFKKMEGDKDMEEDIQEKLEEDYKYILCNVEFKDFRIYKVTITLDYLTTKELKGEIEFKYDVRSSFDFNMVLLEQKIDNKIVRLLKGE